MLVYNNLKLCFPTRHIDTIFTQNGKIKKSIEEQTSTRLIIKATKSGNACCDFTGSRNGPRLALKMTRNLIDGSNKKVLPGENYHLYLTLNTLYGRLLMGADGKNHKAIQHHYGIKMFINPSNNHNFKNLVLSGPLQRLFQMLSLIDLLHSHLTKTPNQQITVQRLLYTPYRFSVPKESIALLMGANGRTHNRLQKDFGIYIGFKFNEENYGMVPIELTRGSMDKYENAVEEIKQLIKQTGALFPGVTRKIFEVPNEKIGLIKGVGCATLNSISERTGTRAYFEEFKCGKPTMKLVIVGSEAGTETALEMFQKLFVKYSKKQNTAQPIQVQEYDNVKRFPLAREVSVYLKKDFEAIAENQKVKIDFQDIDKENVYVAISGPNEKLYKAMLEIISLAMKTPLKAESSSVEPHGPPPATFECSVCFNEFLLRKGVPCHSLDRSDEDEETHSFCIGCTRKFAEAKLSDASSKLAKGGIGLPCMEDKCKHALLLSEIRWYLNETTIFGLEARCMDESIASADINGLTRCAGCDYLLIIDGGDRFTCPECNRTQCRYCPREYNNSHFAKTCQQLTLEEIEQKRQEEARIAEEARQERLRAEEAARHAEEAERARHLALVEEASRRERNLADNRLSEEAVQKLRKCANPNCCKPVEKISGCNHMLCKPPGGCGSEFCYACGAIWITSHQCGQI